MIFFKKLKKPKLIKTWAELYNLKPNDKYKVIPDDDGYEVSAWIVPIKETDETKRNYYRHHVYLSTHTFYGTHYTRATNILQAYGFNVEIDNWDKEDN